MSTVEYLSSYIKKLSHPIKEIRERSLQLLIAKLRLGWEIEDELSGTRALLEALLAWFHIQKSTLQREALELLLTTIKTKAGNYIVKELGAKQILSSLNSAKNNIDPNALEVYHDVIETLQFLNTIESEVNVNIPRLNLPSVTSSESDKDSIQGYYNINNECQSSKGTSISNDDNISNNICNISKDTNGIQVLLFPWVELSSSDSKTILLVEDALKLLKSTKRCCRFICDVFLRDFPAEIFLNRPMIIQNLLLIADLGHDGKSSDALLVLLCITQALCIRVLELTSLDFMNDANQAVDFKEIDDGLNLELRDLAGGCSPDVLPRDDSLAALRQLLAPIYALDALHAILTTMARSVILVDAENKNEVLDTKSLNICSKLVETLIQLLLKCVGESFWSIDHTTKTHRDIAHKSCMVMRLLGDLLMKYKRAFTDHPENTCHRVAWLRLVSCAEKLLYWARNSALPPSTLVTSLQAARLDPALELLYPDLSRNITDVLQSARISVDQEYKTKYKEFSRLVKGMDEAVKFMKNRASCRTTKELLTCVKSSLPVLEVHLSEAYLDDVADILLRKTKSMNIDESDWSFIRSIALNLMAHHIEWVRAKFYRQMALVVKSVLASEEMNQIENEKCLMLLCDVSVLTELCCHGLSSKLLEVENSAAEIMVYFLRGRMVLSESCWWRLLASLQPVLPLLHVYAAHDTQIGQAICKSLEPDIAECMGVSASETIMGLVRLLFVQCVTVKLEAAHALCQLLNDRRYLPPRESLRTDVLLNALRRIQPQSFNVDTSSSPSKNPQTTGLVQMLDVLKQDIILDEHGSEYVTRVSVPPALEPSLRRSTLQQLAVIMRQQDMHEMFLQCDGLKVIVAILRMSMLIDDYLAFPECAISCVSILNSVCFTTRHTLAKIQDLPSLLLRVILVFPANDSAVLMSAQVLALIAWSGFALQELDANRRTVPALPLSVTQRAKLPFCANSYWSKSPNSEHSSIEWLVSEEDWRAAIRVRWWCAWESPSRVLKGASHPPAPLSLRPTARDLALLQAASPTYAATKALLALENATSHRQVNDALRVLESYTHLVKATISSEDFSALPWQHLKRFLCAPPASPRDTALLISLLQLIIVYIDNVPRESDTLSWIKSCFIGNDTSIISLLSRDELFPQQTSQDNIEVTQLHINIVKVLLRCVVSLEVHDNFDSGRLESLIKILLACLEKIDLRNFHKLGYLNELVRCIRYAIYSRYCKLSEETLIECFRLIARTLSGCASGGGRKGQACRLDAMLAMLAMLRQIHEERIPVQRWSESCDGVVMRSILACASGARAELRAASLRVMAALSHYAQLLPQLMQAVPSESLSQFASSVFSSGREANAVRAAAAALLTAVASRTSPHTDVLEIEVLEQLRENNFFENSIQILVDFCNEKEYQSYFEPNVPLYMLERRSELEVRAEKCSDVRVTPSVGAFRKRPPTAGLVAAVADVFNNISAFKKCPVQQWNELGLYRLLFRCASWSNGSLKENNLVRASTCRALVAASTFRCVRATLSATKDCLINLMNTLTPLEEDEWDRDCLSARAQGLLLVGSLLSDRSAGDTVWAQLKEKPSMPFFCLLLQSLDSDELDFQDAGLYCLTQLAQSTANKKHPDKTKDLSCMEFLNNLRSPFFNSKINLLCAGDSQRDCQPEYIVEELCKVLMNLYQKLTSNNMHESSQDERWCRLCSCLSSLLSVSVRSRLYCVHRQFARVLLATLQVARDRLSIVGKPVEVIRNANNDPTLRTLYWLLTLSNCLMLECGPAKECFADDNIALSLNRLWPWCMMTEQLREAVVNLLLTFTNDCPKGWSSMCLCVGGRSLVAELCVLASKEASHQSRVRCDALLVGCVRALQHCAAHTHCRAILLKSDVLQSLHKLRTRLRSAALTTSWVGLCTSLARHGDGATAVLALRPLPSGLLLPAVAHAAHHTANRATFLNDPVLLELLSGSLLTGDTSEIVAAARAVWALAANNHKAKLLLRSARVTAAVNSALLRLQRSTEPTSQRALQLLTYTNTVLQTT